MARGPRLASIAVAAAVSFVAAAQDLPDPRLAEARRLWDAGQWVDASRALKEYRHDHGATFEVDYLLATAQCMTGDLDLMRDGFNRLGWIRDHYEGLESKARDQLHAYERACEDEFRWRASLARGGNGGGGQVLRDANAAGPTAKQAITMKPPDAPELARAGGVKPPKVQPPVPGPGDLPPSGGASGEPDARHRGTDAARKAARPQRIPARAERQKPPQDEAAARAGQ